MGLMGLIIVSVGIQIGQLDAPVRSQLLRILEPAMVWQQSQAKWQERWQHRWRIATQGADRLAQLEQENITLQLQLQQNDEFMKENDLLRQALGQRQRPSAKYLRLYGSAGSWFVNGGADEGFQTGDIILHEGALIGMLGEVYPHFSKVQTIWQTDWRLPVLVTVDAVDAVDPNAIDRAVTEVNTGADVQADPVASDSATLGDDAQDTSLTSNSQVLGLWQSIRGYGEVLQVPQSAKLATGSAIVTRGNADVPPNLPLATVRRWQTHNDGATWEIIAEPYWNLADIVLVEVQPR